MCQEQGCRGWFLMGNASAEVGKEWITGDFKGEFG